jgi:hypothetical protein
MYAYTIICIHNIIQKNAPNPKTSSELPPTPAQLLRWFVRLLPGKALRKVASLQSQSFYERLFTPLVTLWYLLFQRLNPDHSLEAALVDARSGGADRLNHKLSGQLVSDSTCSYSDARQRLAWQFLAEALVLQASNLIGLSPTTLWHGLVLALLDGSTVRLRPYGAIAKEFPPNRNQHKEPYWCLMRVVVGFCALSGAALDCALGSIGLSEQALACRIILASAAKSLFIGDRNFGVFRIAQVARHAGQTVLVRMTEVRARKLLGGRWRTGDHQVLWKPTRHDQLQPEASGEPIAGRLLVVKLRRNGFRTQQLCLFTTLPNTSEYSLEELVRVYGLRWHIELNLRYLKTQMDLVQLEAKSPEMARKEWLAGLLAYNLIRAAQLCAAVQKGISPLSLSFSSVRRHLEEWLHQFGRGSKRQLSIQWPKLLEQLSRCRLPHRRKPRPNEPRAQRHLRQSYLPLHGSRSEARKHLDKYCTKS